MGPYNTGDNGTEDGNTPRNYVDSSIPFGGSFDVPNRPRSRVASVESFSSTQDDWRHYLENSSADDPLPALYSAVSSQFLSRNTEMTPSSLMDELKRHSKRDGLLHRQSMPSSALLSESPALPSELTRSNASSVPVRQLSVRESCTKSPVLQLNGQFQESDQSARVGPLGGVPTFPLIPAIQVMPSKSVDSLSQNGLSNAPPRSPAPQRVISALADPVMIDPVTAAALNSQNWADEAEEETSESDEEQVEADRASTTGTVQSGEGRVLIGSPNLNGLIHLPELIPSSGLSESASARHPKKGKTPAYAWKKFSANIRKVSGREFSSKGDGRSHFHTLCSLSSYHSFYHLSFGCITSYHYNFDRWVFLSIRRVRTWIAVLGVMAYDVKVSSKNCYSNRQIDMASMSNGRPIWD